MIKSKIYILNHFNETIANNLATGPYGFFFFSKNKQTHLGSL